MSKTNTNCDICGRRIDTGKSLRCDECGIQNLCYKCVENVGEHFLCIRCIKDKGWSCDLCEKKYISWCQSCGIKCCSDHLNRFDFIPRSPFDEINNLHYSLYCPKCRGNICNKCYITIERTLRSTVEHCKRCGTRLVRNQPLAMIHKERWKQVFPNNIDIPNR